MDTTKSDVAWLIELPQSARPGEPPTYWGWVEGQQGWTSNVNDAIQYETKAGADEVAAVYCDEYAIVEHAWYRELIDREPDHGQYANPRR